MRNLTGFSDNTERHEIVGLAQQVGGDGFNDMEPEELNILIASHAELLTEEELAAITKFPRRRMKRAVMRKRCRSPISHS